MPQPPNNGQYQRQGGGGMPPGLYGQQQRATNPNPAPAQRPWDPQKERNALRYLGQQLAYCSGNVQKFGNPTPLQAKNLLFKFGKDLLTCLPFPPPDIRSSVLQYFQQVGWDVRNSRPCPGSGPPNGTQIVGLVHELTKYFSLRCGVQPPSMPVLNIPQRTAPLPKKAPVQRTPQTISHASQPQRGYHQGGKGQGQGYQYQNQRGHQHQGGHRQQGGYQNRNQQHGGGGKGASYQQNRNYTNSTRQNYGNSNNNNNSNRGRSSDGFQTVGGNRRGYGGNSVNHSGNASTVNHSGGTQLRRN